MVAKDGTEEAKTPVPRTELEEIQMNINLKQDESLESTRRMRALCEDAKDAGIRTLVMLDEQGEQLDNVNVAQDKINQDMKEAEKNLTGMDKCCGIFVCPWNKGKNFEKGADYEKTWKESNQGAVGTGPRVTVPIDGTMGPTGGYITKITNDAREDEMEENLGEVVNMISNLRNMAVDMGGEIDQQNRLLDQINCKADSNQARVAEANKRADRLLKK